jgi:hypothetical protein
MEVQAGLMVCFWLDKVNSPFIFPDLRVGRQDRVGVAGERRVVGMVRRSDIAGAYLRHVPVKPIDSHDGTEPVVPY